MGDCDCADGRHGARVGELVGLGDLGADGGDVMDGNYRPIIEPEKKPEQRNRTGLLVLELALIVPAAAVVVALLLVALFGRG